MPAESREWWQKSWAHLTGYALIAAAIFFGLRQRNTTPPNPAPSAAVPDSIPTRSAAPPHPPPPVASVRIDPPGSARARDGATARVQKALDAQHAAIAKACAAFLSAPSTKLSVRFLIEADGREASRSSRQESGTPNTDLIQCIHDQPRIRIAPPGERVGVVATLSFP